MTLSVYNVTEAIDQGSATKLLVKVALLCATIAFLDGMDTTSISIAAPRIADQLGLSHGQLGPVFSAGLLGAMLGALSFGTLADRYGRRRMLLLATTMFALFTLSTTVVSSFYSLLVVRLLTGIGLGGATPCFIALASEYASKAQRARVTSLIWTAFPLGTVLGTFMCAYLISAHGWRSIFVIGGVVPLVVAAALFVWLPESLQFLLAKGKSPVLIRRIARHIEPGLGADVQFVFEDAKIQKSPLASLFSDGQSAQTMLIWFAFAAVFGTTAAIFFWAPIMMRDHGIPLSRGAIVLGVSGIGSLIGSSIAGFLMGRFRPVVVLSTAFCLGAAAVSCIGYAAGALPTVALDLLLTGFLIAGLGASGLLVFAAEIYPTIMRSTGIGSAMGLGRFGQVVMPLLTSVMISIGFRSSAVFPVIGIVMLLGALTILSLRRHRIKSIAPAVR